MTTWFEAAKAQYQEELMEEQRQGFTLERECLDTADDPVIKRVKTETQAIIEICRIIMALNHSSQHRVWRYLSDLSEESFNA